MFAPFFCHWLPSGAVPAATTANVAVCPAVTVWFAGCVVIVGATAAAFTVSVAALLVPVSAELLTTTRDVEPLSALVVVAVVSFADVAPVMLTPFFCHCLPR